MIRIQINQAFDELLRANELHNYHQIMQISSGHVIEEDEFHDVQLLDLNGQNLYLKRTKIEKFSSAFENYCRGRLAHSKPFNEMLQYRHLSKFDFEVAEVVAAGEELLLGIPLRGFIITREVEGRDLSLVFREADNTDRQRIMGLFGSLMGRIHSHGFFGLTRLKDIFIVNFEHDFPILTLIDREARNPYPTPPTRKRVMAKLLFNIRRQATLGELFTDHEWQSFTESYCQSLPASLDIGSRQLLAEVLALLDSKGRRVTTSAISSTGWPKSG
jgi:hypothetical protein